MQSIVLHELTAHSHDRRHDAYPRENRAKG
jgi:hypothetical protein